MIITLIIVMILVVINVTMMINRLHRAFYKIADAIEKKDPELLKMAMVEYKKEVDY